MMPLVPSAFVGLRDVQKKQLKGMLNYNRLSPTDPDMPDESAWKVLILDAAGQAILSPILKVNELRESGITLYLQLHGDRQPITDVPAIYFVEPTSDNIQRIAQDLRSGLYDQVYLNFTSSIPRALLEDLAQLAAQTNSSHLIAKVYDQYLNYECLEKNLFTFSMDGLYRLMNSPRTAEGEIDASIDRITASLFSVFVSMGGQCPVICSVKGTVAEMVGQRLDRRLRSHMTNIQSNILGESNMGDSASFQRPLLVLLDRNFDLCTPLKHVSTYNALVHDVLGMRLNRINITTKEGPRTFDIDAADHVWGENASLPFPKVAENVDAALGKYKKDMQQVTRNSGVTSIDDLRGDHGATLTAEELRIAINVLPELTERKRLIDCHLQLAMALLEQIKERNIGDLYLAEQKLGELNKAAILGKLQDPKQGNASDKMRFFLVVFFSGQVEVTPGDMPEYERALREAGCDMAILEAAKTIRAHHRMTQLSSTSVGASSPRASEGDFISALSSRITSTTTGVLGNIVTSVRNLLPESTETLLTKQLDQALEQTASIPASSSSASNMFRGGAHPTEEPFVVHDPRVKQQASSPTRHSFNHVIVFVIGGSNYSEYNHAEEWARKKAQQTQLPLQVTFGTTSLVTGAGFLEELRPL